VLFAKSFAEKLPQDVNRPAILLLAVRRQGCARFASASTLTALARQLRVLIDSRRRSMSCPTSSNDQPSTLKAPLTASARLAFIFASSSSLTG
jgi:hypothetical protein